MQSDCESIHFAVEEYSESIFPQHDLANLKGAGKATSPGVHAKPPIHNNSPRGGILEATAKLPAQERPSNEANISYNAAHGGVGGVARLPLASRQSAAASVDSLSFYVDDTIPLATPKTKAAQRPFSRSQPRRSMNSSIAFTVETPIDYSHAAKAATNTDQESIAGSLTNGSIAFNFVEEDEPPIIALPPSSQLPKQSRRETMQPTTSADGEESVAFQIEEEESNISYIRSTTHHSHAVVGGGGEHTVDDRSIDFRMLDDEHSTSTVRGPLRGITASIPINNTTTSNNTVAISGGKEQPSPNESTGSNRGETPHLLPAGKHQSTHPPLYPNTPQHRAEIKVGVQPDLRQRLPSSLTKTHVKRRRRRKASTGGHSHSRSLRESDCAQEGSTADADPLHSTDERIHDNEADAAVLQHLYQQEKQNHFHQRQREKLRLEILNTRGSAPNTGPGSHSDHAEPSPASIFGLNTQDSTNIFIDPSAVEEAANYTRQCQAFKEAQRKGLQRLDAYILRSFREEGKEEEGHHRYHFSDLQGDSGDLNRGDFAHRAGSSSPSPARSSKAARGGKGYAAMGARAKKLPAAVAGAPSDPRDPSRPRHTGSISRAVAALPPPPRGFARSSQADPAPRRGVFPSPQPDPRRGVFPSPQPDPRRDTVPSPQPDPEGEGMPGAHACRCVAGLLGVGWPPARPGALYALTGARLTPAQVRSFYEAAHALERAQAEDGAVAAEASPDPRFRVFGGEVGRRSRGKAGGGGLERPGGRALAPPKKSKKGEGGEPHPPALPFSPPAPSSSSPRPCIRRTKVLREVFDFLDWNRRGYLGGADIRTYQYLLEDELRVLGGSKKEASLGATENNANIKNSRAISGVSLMSSVVHEQQLYHKAFENLSRGLKAINGVKPSERKISNTNGYFNKELEKDDNSERVLEKAALNQKGRRLLLIFLAAKVILPLLISSQISSIDFPTFSIIVLSTLKNELSSMGEKPAERQGWFRIIHICFALLS